LEAILVQTVLPVLAVMALGYGLGRRGLFSEQERHGLEKLVLDVALPAALFVSIQQASRDDLLGDGALVLASLAGVVGPFVLSYLLCRRLFGRTAQEAAVCALVAGSPTIGFLGLAVLGPAYGGGAETSLIVGIVSIATKGVTTAIGLALLEGGLTRPTRGGLVATDPAANCGGAATLLKNALGSCGRALRQPVCWAPLLAMGCVLAGVRAPSWLDPCFHLVGRASSGVAVLSAGLALASVRFTLSREVLWNVCYRLLLSPAAVLGIGLALGLAGGGERLAMLVTACALPPSFSGIVIAGRYGAYLPESASTVALATLGFACTLPLWVWLAPLVCKLAT
jgi:hypothetical protein